MLQCVAVCCSVLHTTHKARYKTPTYLRAAWLIPVAMTCSALQHVASCCSVLQCTDTHSLTHTYTQELPLLRTIHDMGWLRLVGSLRLWVSFAEYSLFYRALLQTRPIILRSLLIVTTQFETPSCLRAACLIHFAVRCSELQWVAVSCSKLQWVEWVAMSSSELQCVAVCCSGL